LFLLSIPHGASSNLASQFFGHLRCIFSDCVDLYTDNAIPRLREFAVKREQVEVGWHVKSQKLHMRQATALHSKQVG
jgi:hypothetical protein